MYLRGTFNVKRGAKGVVLSNLGVLPSSSSVINEPTYASQWSIHVEFDIFDDYFDQRSERHFGTIDYSVPAQSFER